MGEEPLKLRTTEDGVLMVGDLWDARTSKRVGFNLFGNRITKKPVPDLQKLLTFGPSVAMENYEFSHILNSTEGANKLGLDAEITCDIMGGIIKVTGGFNFEVGWSNAASTEEFLQIYETAKKLVTVNKLPPDEAYLYYDPHVEKLLSEQKLPHATHVVTEMDIGGRMSSTLKITQTKTGDEYKVGFFVDGSGFIGPLPARLEASASVGEDIQISNYNCAIKLSSMPPVPPPTGVEDFVPIPPETPGGGTIGDHFTRKLNNEKHFEYWNNLPNTNGELIGVPMYFKLQAIEDFFTPKPPTPPPTPPPEEIPESKFSFDPVKKKKSISKDKEALLEKLQGVLLDLRDISGDSYYRRRLLIDLPRIQKLLHEPTHLLTEEILSKEQALKKDGSEKMFLLLQKYSAYKNALFADGPSKDELQTMVDTVFNSIAEIKVETTEFVARIVTDSKEELDAVNVVTEQDPPEDPEVAKEREERSPLLYFTSVPQLTSWLEAKRYCKLLYRAYTPKEEDEWKPDYHLPQKIYNMSHGLGSVYIQPGIAYPTLSEKLAKKKRHKRLDDNFKELLSINTPTGSLSYGRSAEDWKKINFILDLLTALTGMEDGRNSRMGHLYITYTELHGLTLKLNHTQDVIPLLELMYGTFGEMEITHSSADTMNRIKEREEFTLVFTQDGVHSSRDVVYSLLEMQQVLASEEESGNQILCGTFDITALWMSDAPPLFLAWNTNVRGVCLDHLDLLVAKHIHQEEGGWEGETLEKIEKLLDLNYVITRKDTLLCSQSRLDYANEVRQKLSAKKEKMEEISRMLQDPPPSPQVDMIIEVVTGVLNAPVEGPKPLANAFTKYTIHTLEFDPEGHFVTHWDPGSQSYQIDMGDPGWSVVLEQLQIWFSQRVGFEYYVAVGGALAMMQVVGDDIPVPIVDPEEEEAIPPGGRKRHRKLYLLDDGDLPETPQSQYDMIKTSLKDKFPDDVDPTFWAEIEKIRSISAIQNYKSSARLYASALAGEVGRLEQDSSQSLKLQAMNHLIKVVRSISNSAKVPDYILHGVMQFCANIEIFKPAEEEDDEEDDEEPDEQPFFPEEIVYRLKTNLRLKRYYHFISDLVENTPTRYGEFEELSKYQLEMNRLTDITDWLNLIRLIQELSPNPEDKKKFKNKTLRKIWSNLNFRYLIETNLGIDTGIGDPKEPNQFVLRALVKGFISQDNSVPSYIPRNIAKVMMTLDMSPEGYPIGFQPVWESGAILLKSLQILYVWTSHSEGKVLPANIQTELLKNVLNISGKSVAYTELKRVGALYYLNEENEDDKFFTEIWDRETIYDAIIKLMGQGNANPKKMRKPAENQKKLTICKSDKNAKIGKTVQIKEVGSLAHFLQVRKSPPDTNVAKDIEFTLEYFLYHLKLIKLNHGKNGWNPFEQPDRVDTLTQLLSRVVPPLLRELLNILSSKYSSTLYYSLPIMIVNNPNENPPSNYLSIIESEIEKYKKDGGLPPIITSIRIGNDAPYAEGKSQFLNSYCTRNKAAFASRANTGGSSPPQFLHGFVDYLQITGESANPSFYNALNNSALNKKPQDFLLINLHGDALKNPDHLGHLASITSCFLVFWNPAQGWSEILEKKSQFMEAIKPSHASVQLFINPGPDVVSEIEEAAIIRTPFTSQGENAEKNLQNLVHAIETGLLRRGRQLPATNQTPPATISVPRWNEDAVEFVAWINSFGIYRIKSSLILQKGRNSNTITRAELDLHWSSDPVYADLITKLTDILEKTNYQEILTDAAQLLAPLTRSVEIAAWENLNNLSNSEFGHLPFGGGSRDPVKRQALLHHFQNDVDAGGLSVMELLTEYCKIHDLSPTLLPTNPDIAPGLIMSTLYTQSHSMPIPSIPRGTFFMEDWSQDFLSRLSSSHVLVLNCLGNDPFLIYQVLDSLFGINFTSSSSFRSPNTDQNNNDKTLSSSSWSPTAWAGIYMRLLHFSPELQDELNLEGILLLWSKPVCAQTTLGHRDGSHPPQRDRQIATFLICTSNLTLVFDYDESFPDYTATLASSLLALNKIPDTPNGVKTPQLLWLGVNVKQDQSKILAMMSRAKEFAESWIDHGDVSTLGSRVLTQAIQDLENQDNEAVVFDMTLPSSSLVPVSDAIIRLAGKKAEECPTLPDPLVELGPIWDYIRDSVLFPYPDLDEMERSKEFYRMLHDLLNLVDEGFTYHVEDFPTTIFTGMSNIVNSWAKGEEGQVSIPTKKEMLFSDVETLVNKIFDSCEFIDEILPCEFCIAKENKQKEYLERQGWPWDRPDSKFTASYLMQLVTDYVAWERWHYINLASQMMVAFEARLLREEEKPNYLQPDPDFSPKQATSLTVKVVPSVRRLDSDFKDHFPSIPLDWEDHNDGWAYLEELPAFEDDPQFLTDDQRDSLQAKLTPIPKDQVVEGGYTGIYQRGMIRRTVTQVGNCLAELETGEGRKVINTFRLKAICHTIYRLRERISLSEGWWKDDHDPMAISEKDEEITP